MKKILTSILFLALVLPNIVGAQSLTLTKQLKQGQSDAQVSILQRILNNLGKAVTNIGEETNFFGPRTAAAVKEIQCANNIVCSGPTWGLVGPATRGLLSRLQSQGTVLDASTEPGLVAYYGFENNTNDGVGLNNGTAAGNPTYTAGKVGQAIQLDGVDDEVYSSSLFSTFPSAITISSWVNWSNITNNSFQVAGRYDGSSKGIFIGSYNPGAAQCRVNTKAVMGSIRAISTGQWYLITCVYDGSNINLYVNDKLVSTGTTTPITNTASPFRIGRYQNNSLFPGKIDDVRVYDRALSLSDVSNIYAGTVSAPIPTPVNGQCSSTVNQCAPGVFSDVTDTSTDALWTCVGSSGGTSASCTSPLSVATSTPSNVITIAKSGTGSGTVTGTGISCGTDCSETYTSVTSVTLTATPATGSKFIGWTGACSSVTSTTCTVSVSGIKTVGIEFNTITTSDPSVTSAPTVVGTTVAAASCSQADVQAAANLAKDGDTIFIPEGTCEWTKTVKIDAINPSPRSLIIRGAGCTMDAKGLPTSCKTVLKDNIDKTLGNNQGADESMINISTLLGKNYRVTELEIQPGARTTEYYDGATIYLTGTSKSVRVDHIKTGPTKNRSIFFTGAALGVVDSSRFNYFSHPIFIISSSLFGKSWGDGSFENDVDWGGPGSVYVENNEFIADLTSWVGALDGWGGARAVFRKNTVIGGKITLHGTESSGRLRGGRSMEAYDNTFTTLDPYRSGTVGIDLRSATAVVFNNVVRGHYNGSLLGLNCYRTMNTFPPWGQADGTKSWDVNDYTDGPGTPGGAGNGVFETGTADSVGRNLLTDTSKNWTVNQWNDRGYVLRQIKNFIATSGTKGNVDAPTNAKPGTVTVAGAGWTTNQWAGWEITKISDNSKSYITSNTSDTLTISKEFYPLDMTGGGEFQLSLSGQIIGNTANTITLNGGFEGAPRLVVAGLNYEIRRVSSCLDGPGKGKNAPLVYDATARSVYRPNHQNINQLVEPVYQWNNVKDKAGYNVSTNIVGAGRYPIYEGRDFINAPKPGYTPYIYPHPLATSGFTSDDPSSPFVAPYVPPVPPPPQPSDPTPPPTTPTDTDSDGVIDSLDRCPATPTSLKSIVNNYGCPKPLLINFDIKPDVTNLDLSSVGVLELGRTNIGKVTWKEAVALTRNTTQIDVDTNLKIERNKVTLISNVVPELNKPAQITLYGITQTNPTIKRDNVICPQPTCIINSFSNGTLVFTVTGFSTYEVVEGVTPPQITPPSTPTPPPTTGDPTPQPISGGGGGGNTNIYYPTNNTSVPCAQGQIFSTVTGQRCTTYTGGVPTVGSSYAFTRNLTLGATGEDVRQLQIFLNSQGYTIAQSGNGSAGNETTYFGPATRAALIRYQISQGITPAEGYFGPLTRSKLQGNPTYNTPTPTTQSTYTRNLTVGDRGSDVTALQNFLISQSLLDPSNNTGYFGSATKAALAAWQRAQGISPAEGYFGPLTRLRFGN